MPKLPKNIQKAAEEAELSTGGSGALWPVGTYILTCKDVKTGEVSANKNPKWIFIWECDGPSAEDPEGGTPSGELWEHCALTEAAAWKIKQIYASMGFTLDSDADELVGEKIGAVITHGPDNKNPDITRHNAYFYFDPETLEEVLANAKAG